MPKRLGRSRPAAPIAALVGLALVASACGSGTATEPGTAAEAAPAAQSPDDNSAAAVDPATDNSSTDPSAAEAPAPSESEAPIENLFPPVDVVRVDDGSTLNLASELGGGELPVLLWFWAPH